MGELGETSSHVGNERSDWSWEVLECEGVWDVVGVRRFGELAEQSCSLSALCSGVWERKRRGECGFAKIPASGVAMHGNGIEECGMGWRGCGCGFVALCVLCSFVCVHHSTCYLVLLFYSLINFKF